MSAVTLARVDEIDVAVGGATLADAASIRGEEQILDSNCAGMERHIGCPRAPIVVGNARSPCGDQRSCSMGVSKRNTYSPQRLLRERVSSV